MSDTRILRDWFREAFEPELPKPCRSCDFDGPTTEPCCEESEL